MTDNIVSKIATGEEIVAAAIRWRNLFYAADKVRAPYKAQYEAWNAERDAYEAFCDILDTRREIVK